MESRNTDSPPPDAVVRDMVNGFMLTQALAAVAELGVSDRLAAQPLTVTELADATGSNGDALFRLIRYLAGFGIYALDDDRRVGNTALSETLCRVP